MGAHGFYYIVDRGGGEHLQIKEDITDAKVERARDSCPTSRMYSFVRSSCEIVYYRYLVTQITIVLEI